MVCTQFHLEQKRQFSFRDTLRTNASKISRLEDGDFQNSRFRDP